MEAAMLILNTDNYLLTDTMSYTTKCSLYYHRVEKLKSSYVLIIIFFSTAGLTACFLYAVRRLMVMDKIKHCPRYALHILTHCRTHPVKLVLVGN